MIDVLRGAQNQRIQSLGHDRLSTYGIGRELSQEAWGSLIRQLLHLGYLEQDMGNFAVVRLSPLSRPVLRGDERVVLARPRVRLATPKKEPKRGREELTYDRGLFEELRALRKRLADDQQVPPFVVFGDATLAEMAARRPHDAEAMGRISGVGKHKLARYGEAFLQLLQKS